MFKVLVISVILGVLPTESFSQVYSFLDDDFIGISNINSDLPDPNLEKELSLGVYNRVRLFNENNAIKDKEYTYKLDSIFISESRGLNTNTNSARFIIDDANLKSIYLYQKGTSFIRSFSAVNYNDEDGKLIKTNIQDWDGEESDSLDKVPKAVIDYSYDGNDLIDYYRCYNIVDSVTVLRLEQEFIYDSLFLLTQLNETLDSIENRKFTFHHDSLGNIERMKLQKFNENRWVDKDSLVIRYDTLNRIDTIRDFEWSTGDSIWELSQTVLFQYSQNNKLPSTGFVFFGEASITGSRFEQYYRNGSLYDRFLPYEYQEFTRFEYDDVPIAEVNYGNFYKHNSYQYGKLTSNSYYSGFFPMGADSEVRSYREFFYKPLGETSVSNTIINVQDIVLYPNPSNDILHIDSKIIGERFIITIFDVLGRNMLSQEQIINESIDISNLIQGIYYCKIESGDVSVTKSFVKN